MSHILINVSVIVFSFFQVLQSNLHESKEFLSKISLKIPWSSVMQDISLTKPPDYVGKVLATLGKLLIISQLDCAENDVS